MKKKAKKAKKAETTIPAAPVAVAAPPDVKAARVLERSVCLTLSCHYLGNERKVKVDDLTRLAGGTEHLDDEAFRATKKLVAQRELTPVMRVFGGAKADLRALAIAAHRVFGERSYLVPVASVRQAHERLAARRAELLTEAAALAARYVQAVDRQRELLGPEMFRAADYRTPAEVAAAFSLDWYWVSFQAPDRLETVDEALYHEAEQRHERRLASAYDEVVVGLRETARDVFRELAERLGPGKDGQPRVLRGSALDDLRDFAARLPALNSVAQDGALEAAVRRVVARAEGLDVGELRDDESLRAGLRAAAASAATALDGLVTAGRRAISFGDLTAA